MEEHFVWMTTRKIKPGTLAEFERAWEMAKRQGQADRVLVVDVARLGAVLQ